MIKVLLADDHDLVRNGIKNLLEEAQDIEVVAEASNGEQAIVEFQRCLPDVAILDIAMSPTDGLDSCRRIKTHFPNANILILSMYPEEQYATRSIKAGARGYVTKRIDAQELHRAVRTVAQGQLFLGQTSKDMVINQMLDSTNHADILSGLSDREAQIFRHLAQGMSMKSIAASLNLSVKTIDTYRSRILKKLDMHRTADIIVFANRHGLV